MKKYIKCFFALLALALMVSPCRLAYAYSYPEYTICNETLLSNYAPTRIENWFANKGYNNDDYPYQAYLDYSGADSTCYVYVKSKVPIVVWEENGQFYIGGHTSDTMAISYLNNTGNWSGQTYLPFNGNNLRLYSEYTIKGEDGTTFFLGAPLPIPRTELATIVEQSTLQQNPMSQVISLLPLLISLAVSFLALRKCLTTLWTLLRQG